jgi:hypothetical protein
MLFEPETIHIKVIKEASRFLFFDELSCPPNASLQGVDLDPEQCETVGIWAGAISSDISAVQPVLTTLPATTASHWRRHVAGTSLHCNLQLQPE